MGMTELSFASNFCVSLCLFGGTFSGGFLSDVVSGAVICGVGGSESFWAFTVFISTYAGCVERRAGRSRVASFVVTGRLHLLLVLLLKTMASYGAARRVPRRPAKGRTGQRFHKT